MLINDPFVRRYARVHVVHVENSERPASRHVGRTGGSAATVDSITAPIPWARAGDSRGDTGGTQVCCGGGSKALAVGTAANAVHRSRGAGVDGRHRVPWRRCAGGEIGAIIIGIGTTVAGAHGRSGIGERGSRAAALVIVRRAETYIISHSRIGRAGTAAAECGRSSDQCHFSICAAQGDAASGIRCRQTYRPARTGRLLHEVILPRL